MLLFSLSSGGEAEVVRGDNGGLEGFVFFRQCRELFLAECQAFRSAAGIPCESLRRELFLHLVHRVYCQLKVKCHVQHDPSGCCEWSCFAGISRGRAEVKLSSFFRLCDVRGAVSGNIHQGSPQGLPDGTVV